MIAMKSFLDTVLYFPHIVLGSSNTVKAVLTYAIFKDLQFVIEFQNMVEL